MIPRILFALLLGMSAIACAAEPNRYAASIVPAQRFDSGSLHVEQHGKRGRPLVLIPGLASGSWVWQETVRQFSADHVLYLVTLPGFDGRAPLPGPALETVRQDLLKLIAERKLAKPVLVGHSLGGTVALALAAQEPDLIGGVVSIEGLPVFPGSENLAPPQRAQMAAGMLQRQERAEAFAPQQQAYMRGNGVLDMARADQLAQLSARSDPAAVTRYVAEVMGTDLRQQLPRIKAPVLLLYPYFQDDDSQHQMDQAMKGAYYSALMAGTPALQVLPIAPARHFAMFDQPQAVHDAIRAYLKSL